MNLLKNWARLGAAKTFDYLEQFRSLSGSASLADDFYHILGVNRDASSAEIQKAYYGVAKKLHPYKNRDDPEAEWKFKEVSLLYEVLKDEKKRRLYDQVGHEAFVNQESNGFGKTDVLQRSFHRTLSLHSPYFSGLFSMFCSTPSDSPLLPGMDANHWLVVCDMPFGISPKDFYTGLMGDDADKIYSVSKLIFHGFGVFLSEESAMKLRDVPEVMLVIPDVYLNVTQQLYCGTPVTNLIMDFPARDRLERGLDDHDADKQMKMLQQAEAAACRGSRDALQYHATRWDSTI